MTAALRYSSVNSMLGFEQSKRDDLESLGYVMIYFLKGQLPWQNISAKNKDELYKLVLKAKLETPLNVLTEDLPEEFREYLTTVRSMDYESEPDYNILRKMFQNLLKEKGLTDDQVYDWHKDSNNGISEK